jgi:hypothetical protein
MRIYLTYQIIPSTVLQYPYRNGTVSKLHTEVVPAQHNTRYKANVRQTDEKMEDVRRRRGRVKLFFICLLSNPVLQYPYRNGTATHACLTWYVL